MNAVLVFDPANDLVFAKSNKLFRKSILKYSKLNGLLHNNSSSSSSSSSTTSASSGSSFSSASTTGSNSPSESNRCSQRQPTSSTSNSSHRRRLRARNLRPTTNSQTPQQQQQQQQPAHLEDTDKQYLDILMLLLTPYVASLRLSSNLSAYEQLQRERHSRLATRGAISRNQKQTLNENNEQDLLSKFMSSVSVNHECSQDNNNNTNNTSYEQLNEQQQTEPESGRFAAGDLEFAPRRFSNLQMPVECLKDCQIVYCELYDFIFILMQHLEQVSSFKMRLLQKRIDFFARLSLLLFGTSLNSMRISQKQLPQPLLLDQSQVLRQTYQVWLEHQFDTQFLLEANERLIVGKATQQLCQETLQRVSRHLRAKSSVAYRYFKETHMHSLLYSNTKLVSSFSCRNSQPLSQDDLILLLLILKTYNIHHENEFNQVDINEEQLNDAEYLIRTCESPQYCYASNYSANKHTYEISSTTSSGCATTSTSATPTAGGGYLSGSSASRNLKHRLKGSQNEHLLKQLQLQHKLPNQMLVFLSTGGKFKERLRTPHMLRLVPLTKGITLILLAEISTSYLCLQINRVLKILFEFSSRSAQIKLNQLAKINDCVSAIKSYFYGENYDDLDNGQLDNHNNNSSSSNLSLNSRVQSRSNLSEKETINDHSSSSSSSSHLQQNGRKSLLGNFFNRYLKSRSSSLAEDEEEQHRYTGSNQDERRCKSIYDTLSELERRQCCQLICRLEDVVSSNVHTYMLQTFNMSVDEHKREALLSSVRFALRDSIDTFVIKPQLRRLNEPMGDYLRAFSEQMDQVRVLARAQLSDYLDYLAVKSNCNLTMGAPLTHDMMAIRSFIYVDRRRQELLVSPMRQSEIKMDRQSMFEGDFCTTVGSEAFEGEQEANKSDSDSDSDSDNGREFERDSDIESHLKRKSSSRQQVDSANDEDSDHDEHRATLGVASAASTSDEENSSSMDSQGAVVKFDPERKSQVARKLEANYSSLPNIVCDDFFNQYSQSVYGQSLGNNLSSPLSKSSQIPESSRVEVSCRISQLDEQRGNRLVRRKLTLVREEEDDDDGDENEHQHQLNGMSTCRLTTNKISVSKEQIPNAKLGRHSFRSFLRSQASGRGAVRSRMKVLQESSAQCEQRSTSSTTGNVGGGLRCFELFCVHQASLLVHRNQVFVEAERLAKRLAETVEDNSAML